MKFYYILLIIAFSIISCTNDDITENDENQFKIMSIDPNTNTIINSKNFTIDSNGKVTKEVLEFNNTVTVYNFQYNQDGKLTKKIVNGSIHQEFFWNDTNDIATHLLSNGVFVKHYFDNEKLIKIEYIGQDGLVGHTTIYDYNQNGNLTSESVNGEQRKVYSEYNTDLVNPLHKLLSIAITLDDPTCCSNNVFNKLTQLQFMEYEAGDDEWVLHQQTVTDYNWIFNANNEIVGLEYLFGPRFTYEYN